MQDVNYQLFTESSIDEVAISLSNYENLNEDSRNNKALQILTQMKMDAFKDYHPMALSGGQKQRIAVACAIASEREIIFFDEPTSGLDYNNMCCVSNQIAKLSEKGITIFIITHDIELALRCCTHVMHMENGNIEEFYELNKQTSSRLKAL